MLDAANPNDKLTVLEKEKSWKRAIHRDQVRYNKHIETLRAAIEAGDQETATIAQDWLLTSPSSKRIAIAQLLRTGKDIDVWTYQDVKTLADSVTVFDPIDEPVTVFAKEKTSKRGFRAIFSFGDRQRVAQRMLTNVIETHSFIRSFQNFDAGVSKTIKRVLSQIDAGNVWLAHSDIRDFFPSFTVEGLTDFLPLPKSVVEAALTGRNMKLRIGDLQQHHYSTQHFIKVARRGLPQGASSSPSISHLCVSQLALDNVTLEHLFNYEDDFLLLAKSEAVLKSRIEQLKSAVGNLPGGKFYLSIKSVAQAADGLDFLGHRIFSRNAEALAEPSVANTNRLAKRLNEIDEQYSIFSGASSEVDTPILLQACADKIVILKGWQNAFHACDPSTEGWQQIKIIEEDILFDLSKRELTSSDLPPASQNATAKQRRFYYYKWFA